MAEYIGSNKDDTFTGGPTADQASGNAGSDKLYGGGGSDTLDGGAGNDILSSADAPGTYSFPYYQNAGVPPFFDTGASHDALTGGDGSDTIFCGYGDDADGGLWDGSYPRPVDTLFVSFQGASAGVDADFRQASITVGGGTIQHFTGLGWVQGSEFNDTINAGLVDPDGYSPFGVIEGMGGNDAITAGYYTGNIYGGDGNDTIDGINGQYLESIHGGAGDDTIVGFNGSDSLYGEDGDDIIQTYTTADGGAGDDVIAAAGSSYLGPIQGGDGNDVITMMEGSGFYVLLANGGTGSDMLTGISGDDQLDGGNGDDLLVSALTNPLSSYYGDVPQDRLTGGAGDDIVNAGFNDSADGGDGIDTLKLTLLDGGAITLDTANLLSARWHNGDGLIKNFEQVSWLQTSHKDDMITVSAQAISLTLDANSGSDTIKLHATGDIIYGGDGNDTVLANTTGNLIDGGDGLDLVSYADASSGVAASLTSGTPTLTAGTKNDLLVDVETVIGSGFHDILSTDGVAAYFQGAGGDDDLRGGAADDTLEGGSGNDRLDGGNGRDMLTGGIGNDTYVVDSAHDTVVEQANQGVDTVVAAVAWTLGDNLENLTLIGTKGISGTGNMLANAITGNAGDNLLTGLDGDDQLDGGAGHDTLVGGRGDDTYLVDSAHDRITEQSGEGTDTVQAAVGWTLGDNLENLVLTGTHGNAGTGNALANTITGNGGDNLLSGLAGDDVIAGGNGKDTIIGGVGRDIVSGGKGADLFVFAAGDFAGTKADSCDRISDYQAGYDKIDLHAVDAVKGGSDDAFRFIGTAAFDGRAGELRYFVSHDVAYLEADTDGDKAGDMRIALDHVGALTAADFVL